MMGKIKLILIQLIILILLIDISFILFVITESKITYEVIKQEEVVISLPKTKDKVVEEIKEIIQQEVVLEKILPDTVLLNVPFTPQAPFAEWSDQRQADGCEEASILMAIYFVQDKELSLQDAKKEIIALSIFEQEQYGEYRDTSTQDTLKVLKAYFKYDNAYVFYDIERKDIQQELALGKVVIVLLDGTKLGNPYYTPPGPTRHALVIRGYDNLTKEYITNDPGTKHGEGYRYDYDVLENALIDYPTGYQEIIIKNRTAMLVVEK